MNSAKLDGLELRDAIKSATDYLTQSAKAVDAINVFPIPDGDTGSNMAATMSEACNYILALEKPLTADQVLATLARGGLYGGRGNSGVILSQALLGLAKGVGEADELNGSMLSKGLQAAADAAYTAVSEPVEGTMLTVLRAAATGAHKRSEGTILEVLNEALAEAERAQERTIDQLPALREAGVRDAGGEGVCVLLRGLVAAIRKELPPPVMIPEKPLAMLPGHVDDGFGYCTEFVLVAGENAVDVEGLRQHTEKEGYGSVVIVGDEQALRVHAHTNEPEKLLQEAGVFGELTRPKFEDMTAQFVRFREAGSGAGLKVGLLALSSSTGFDEIFESLGANVLRLEAIVKPAAGDIATAADKLGPADVIVLPNHKNAIPAAEQAVKLARCKLHVAPSLSLPQGAAAAIAFNGQSTTKENMDALTEALQGTRTVEVSRAVANRMTGGVEVRKGDSITLVDGRIIASTENATEALLTGLLEAEAGNATIVTIYIGAEFEGSLEELAERCEGTLGGVELELIKGGQPLYELVASVEE
ncbi:MAG: hypothetical protein CL897_05670 [Dehalococcoidia bacterium]|nr:hypothetical protein [Dehalococcoidia bacterium]